MGDSRRLNPPRAEVVDELFEIERPSRRHLLLFRLQDPENPLQILLAPGIPGCFLVRRRHKVLDLIPRKQAVFLGEPFVGVQPVTQHGHFTNQGHHNGQQAVRIGIGEIAGRLPFAVRNSFCGIPVFSVSCIRIAVQRRISRMNINDSQILPKTTHDEAARLGFVSSLRAHLSGKVMPGNYDIYEALIEPAFVGKTGRTPADRHEIRRIMTGVPYYQWWSALLRRSQEMMWDCGVEVTERQLPELIETFQNLSTRNTNGKGSMRLDPDLSVPPYLTAADIHIQPGGYHTEQAVADDVSAGAIFETGIQAYGWGINLGGALVKHFRQHWPEFSPLRILDVGCTIGTSTLPWVAAFPDAEVHAIDAAAPILRYGHARARSMGVAVQFSQQNAERTGFGDGSFDLVLSHILLHETSKKALPRFLAECRRLLRPGGLMLHLEVPRGDTPMELFMHDWESYNNNESFSRFMTDIDLCAMAVQAGWSPDEIGMQIVNPKVGFGKKNYVRGEVLFNLLVGRR